MQEAKRMEAEGDKVIKLNIGNPGVFGFNAPDEIVNDIGKNLKNAEPYGDSRGILAARNAIVEDFKLRGISDVGINDIFVGNGVSELILMSMQALLNPGDEVLVPMPDYPLWTAAVSFAGGKAVHYLCDEASDWNPDIKDMRSKVTANTKAVVVINPNNPTGAVYSKETLQDIVAVAKENGLIIFSDEIYTRIVYDGAKHIPIATIDPSLLTFTFDGLSKTWLACGFRAGWMVMTGNKASATGYVEGLDMLSNMRLCPNMLSQFGIQAALTNHESVNPLILPGGRLKEQRDIAVNMANSIPGLSVVPPKGSLYCFPRIDIKRFNITNDEKFAMDLLKEKKVLFVHGTGFNWKAPDHFRIVFLPDKDTLTDAMGRLGNFLETYKQ
jgi:alanine-synthesizing transaminase